MGFVNMMCILVGAPLLQPLIGFILRQNWTGQVGTNGEQIFSLHAYHYALATVLVCIGLSVLLLFFLKEEYCLTREE